MSRMPRIVSALLTLLALAFAATNLPVPAHAQDAPSGQSPHGHGGSPAMTGGVRSEGAPEMALERMKKRLNLTSEQETQLRPILEESAKKMRELSATHLAESQGQPKPPDPEMRNQMMALRDENDAQIGRILTPTQMEEWNKMRAERRQQMEQRMKGGPGGDAPPPAPTQN
jgi:Spy/CpxP family protein refolding chaperone